ncbi:MAG: conjugal transfer protein TraF [Campylobacterota bacterium]|nr:conjugal transfer protein TraF [Campylobacterota bacterium]
MSCKKISLSIATILSLGAVNLSAYEMKPVGFKAVGMGGAGVASNRGSLATYYNPALIGISDYTSEISLNIGVGIRENGLIDTMDQLNNLELTDSLETVAGNAPTTGLNGDASSNIADAIDVLNRIPNGNGLQLLPSVSLSGQFSNYFAIGAYASADVRAKMVIDKNKLNLIVYHEDTNNYYTYDPVADSYSGSTQASYEDKSLEYAIDNGDTYLNVSAMTIAEVPVSFAYPIQRKNGTLSFGITIKPMQVETSFIDLAIDSESDTLTDDLEQNTKSYSALGVDLGVAYKEKHTDLTLALVGKNINKPSFETQADANGNVEKFEMESFFRAGMSLPIWNDNVELAIDADLQQSDTSYEGMKSQYIGGGMEFHPASWFALRAGMMKNIATESIDEGMIYTAGFGFGLKWLQFDLSAQVSENTGTYDGNDIPKYAVVNFSLISRWGDGYNRKKVPQVIENIENELEQNTISPENRERIKRDSEKAFNELDNS